MIRHELARKGSLEPFCDLGDDFFKEELKRLIATRRDFIGRQKDKGRLKNYREAG